MPSQSNQANPLGLTREDYENGQTTLKKNQQTITGKISAPLFAAGGAVGGGAAVAAAPGMLAAAGFGGIGAQILGFFGLAVAAPAGAVLGGAVAGGVVALALAKALKNAARVDATNANLTQRIADKLDTEGIKEKQETEDIMDEQTQKFLQDFFTGKNVDTELTMEFLDTLCQEAIRAGAITEKQSQNYKKQVSEKKMKLSFAVRNIVLKLDGN